MNIKTFLLLFLLLPAFFLSSCSMSTGEDPEKVRLECDSLRALISSRNEQLDGIFEDINALSRSLEAVNAAEGNLVLVASGEQKASTPAKIRANMKVLRDEMENSRRLLAQLEQDVDSTEEANESFKNTIRQLARRIKDKELQIEKLRVELSRRNATVAENEGIIGNLQGDVRFLSKESEINELTLEKQDVRMHRAWFVYGTKSELKKKKILRRGDVLPEAFSDNSQFTEIDIRDVEEIKFYSRSVRLVTSHPEGSYHMEKGKEGQLTLKIDNPLEFWLVSKYLVAIVK